MNLKYLHTAAVVTLLSVSLAGCSKKAMPTLPPAPGTDSVSNSGSANVITPGSQADFAARMAGQDTIYFDTDRFNIDDIDAAALQTQAQWLMQYPAKRAVVQGHADERGTREYNVALGERRANSAKNYLVSIGVDPSRLSVVSYGKERPVALASDEAAWSRNRRAVTLTID